MKQKKGFIRRYMPAFLAAAVFIAFILAYPHAREKANCSLLAQLSTMVMVIPPIFSSWDSLMCGCPGNAHFPDGQQIGVSR